MSDSDQPSNPKLPASAQNLIEQVGSREQRILRGRKRGYLSLWRSVAFIGLIGWTVAVPTLIGVAVGAWIDRGWPSRYSWTLMLMFGGLLIGCVSAWTRIQHEQEER